MKDLQATKLQTPAGFINTIWLLKNVTRNYCTQLTRSRIGVAFVQESLRFRNKRNAEFFCSAKTEAGKATFRSLCEASLSAYNYMLESGEATEDARSVLPGSICTHIFASINLQTLAAIYSSR